VGTGRQEVGESSARPRLEGRQAVVTAAGQGIGRAIALRLADEGAQVLALDVNAPMLDARCSTVLSKTGADPFSSMSNPSSSPHVSCCHR
jgi:2-polyprenyl-3-methyl-5-hydroxy-6-metoxy-1,4-benzoquinol methylase